QGASNEVSVSIERVEELKRKVKIKGEKKEALLTLRQKPEHPSDTYVFTMKMEILLESTSNKLMVDSYKDGVEVPDSSCCSRQVKIHNHMLILDRQIDKVLKLKTSRKMTIKAFKDQEKYEHVGPKVTSAQDGKSLQVDNERLFLDDDLKKLKDHLQVKQAQSLQACLIRLRSQDCELKIEDKA
ncbi:hypothetical protein Tco_1472774, partial [Tanacetum coccineum]